MYVIVISAQRRNAQPPVMSAFGPVDSLDEAERRAGEVIIGDAWAVEVRPVEELRYC